MTPTVICGQYFVEQTLFILKQVGLTRQECLVLWLGRRQENEIIVRSILRPRQISGHDFFLLPSTSMRSIMEHLRNEQLMIAAQIHSHPFKAYHSEADDRWAIVRHVGALSIVIPYFAATTTATNFLDQAAAFELDASDRWIEIPKSTINQRCQIQF